jgi:hypothetical protein
MGEEYKRWWRNSDSLFVEQPCRCLCFRFSSNYKQKQKRTKLLFSDLHMLPRCPKDWNRRFHTVPKRREAKRIMKRLTKDPELADGICFPTGNRRPHCYYW